MRSEYLRTALRAGLALALALCGLTMPGSGPVAAAEPGQTQLDALYGQPELSFEANWGQADAAAKFLARGSGYSLLLTPTEAILALSRRATPEGTRESRVLRKGHTDDGQLAIVRIRLVGSNDVAQILGDGLLPGKVNYFSGSDPAGWRTDIPTYRKVRVEGVYSGVDLVYYGNQRELEYDFVVAPGAAPESIRLAYEGVEDLRVEPGGDLVLRTELGEIRQYSPSVYQEVGGLLKRIPAAHVLLGGREVGFQVKDYDRGRPLVIDPRLSYSTLLGGSAAELGAAIAVDSSGSAYVTGLTVSLNFPVVSPYQGTAGPAMDTFVTKLNPTGTALVYSTYLHGRDGDVAARTIAVDSAGSAYVGGLTTSTSLPTTVGAYRTTTSDTCCTDGFLTKLSPTGSQLVYSTYLAGAKDDEVIALALDAAGAVYAVGETESSANYPITSGVFQAAFAGVSDAFVTKLNPTGAGLAYSTFLGGSGTDRGTGVVVDSAGSAYVAGYTESTAFPTTPGAYQAAGGQRDAFVTKLNSAGSAPVYSSRFGGSGDDLAFSIALDTQGSTYIVGRSISANFPVTAGAYQTTNKGSNDGFALKLNPSGASRVYATLFGGIGSDIPWWVAVDPSGNAYVTGQTASADFPMSADATQNARAGTQDAFVVKVNPAGAALPFSTYLGGSGTDAGYGITLDGSGFVYVVGQTDSANFPTTNGAFQTSLRGSQEAFITKLDLAAQSAPTLAIVSGNNQTGTVGAALPAPLIVELRNSGGPVAGATVTFSSSGATLNPASVQTGADGRASSVVTPTASGTVTINVNAPGAAAVVFTATVQAAPPPVTFTSAASFRGGALAPGMIAVAWGQAFTTGTNVASSIPLPTTLGNVTITVRDSSGTERLAPLFFTSAQQINFYLPEDVQGGPATIRIAGSDARVQTANVTIESVNPGLFSMNADGQGVVAGNVVRVSASGAQTFLDIMRYDNAQRKYVGQPIDFGTPTDRIILVLYGTGLRNHTGLANVNVTVGGIQAKVDYLGTQGSLVGLDQLNFELPRATAGRGEVPISLTVDGKTANMVTVTVAAVTPPPALTSVTPTSARAGDTVNITLRGTSLTGAQIEFDSPTGLTLSNVNSTSTQVTASLSIDATAATGARTVTVSTIYGRSNSLPFTITAAPVPTLQWLVPDGADPGTTVSLRVSGLNLASVTDLEFTPPDGITVSNVSATASSLTAEVAIAPTAAPGPRKIALVYPGGKSGTMTFLIGDPTFVISNLRATLTANSSFTGARLQITVDFEDPQGASVTGQGRMNFNVNNGSITGWSSPVTVTGTTSGTISHELSFTTSYFRPGPPIPISVSIERPAGQRRSNTISGTFQVP